MLSKSQMKTLLAAIFAVAFIACLNHTALAADAVLTADDCVKCHSEQPAQIEANGASHKTEIDCTACHAGHRPVVANNIPQCSECHEGSTHYEVDNCLGCHNPHEPLNIAIEGEQKAVCVSCHAGPQEQMVANPSMHETFSCNFCHADTHGNIPECMMCHEGHSESMTQTDCSTCHQAHMPLAVAYPDSTASELCAACHDATLATLVASQTKHSEISCATCHAEKHMAIPECNECHGLPHPQAMHERFPNCGECHSVAHDLNK